jgi:CBS domain-containing protein
LEEKGHQVWSVRPGDKVYDAIKMMADKDVGSLVVLDGSKIVGVVTERHYARNVFLKGARRHRRESTTSWNVTSVIWSRASSATANS